MSKAQNSVMRRYQDMVSVVSKIDEVPEAPPIIRFWKRMLACYVLETNTIWLPTPEHLAHWHGETIESCRGDHEYLFLHELAHWGTGGDGHTARMYAFLFCLGKMFGYRMMKLRAIEIEYKPRAAKSGWRRYLRTFKEDVA